MSLHTITPSLRILQRRTFTPPSASRSPAPPARRSPQQMQNRKQRARTKMEVHTL